MNCRVQRTLLGLSD